MKMAQIVNISALWNFISPGRAYLKISFVVCGNIRRWETYNH
jgi:hypothetical protein